MSVFSIIAIVLAICYTGSVISSKFVLDNRDLAKILFWRLVNNFARHDYDIPLIWLNGEYFKVKTPIA